LVDTDKGYFIIGNVEFFRIQSLKLFIIIPLQ